MRMRLTANAAVERDRDHGDEHGDRVAAEPRESTTWSVPC